MSKVRLIDANALAQELLSITYLGCDGGYYKGRADERDSVLQRIAAAPTVEKRGEWIQGVQHENSGEDWDEVYYVDCDQCGYRVWHAEIGNTSPPPNYCELCGANMKGEQE